ncbi:MAG: DUF4249 domain-containing protein [Bacteroidales bacterium]|nr:DUF4249 domain-containing protein [Bacteroidales bacterium]
MQKLKHIFFIVALLLSTNSCIDSYTPAIKSVDIGKYVVMGRVDRNDSVQTVNISMTSSVSDPKYIPIIGCSVVILDDQGHEFPLYSLGDGSYVGWVDPQYMTEGSRFKIKVITPKNEVLESDYDQMPTDAKIDSVYYELKNIEEKSGHVTHGIQFYLNMNDIPANSHYFKWNVYETWEHRTLYPIEWYYDGKVEHVFPPDSSKMICWNTDKSTEIYIMNTENFTGNSYQKFTLNFVSNETEKLAHGYSLLVEQVALSQAAYDFWQRMKLNYDRGGNLYEKQPAIILGNMHDVSDPKKEVLGYFSATASQKKRIFVASVPQLSITYPDYCNFNVLGRGGFLNISPFTYPAYLASDGKGGFQMVVMGKECVDCMLFRGTNVKPSFWPWPN